jgi:polar amino acid transport system substrate-binding protein/glutamate/aspartate transport system substrate-binding protein
MIRELAAGATMAAMALCAGGQALAEGVLDGIRDRGEIRIGFRENAPPFSYRGKNGAPTGLAVWLCQDVAVGIQEHLGLDGLKFTYVPVTAASRFDALENGETDIHCGPATATLDRRETLDFSIPYFVDGSSAALLSDAPDTLAELNGAAIGVLKGTTTVKVAQDLIAREGLDSPLRLYDDHAAGLTALTNGEIGAYFGDQAILIYQLGQLRPEKAVKLSRTQFSFEPYALAMKRGESDLRLEVDRALSKTYRSGAIHDHLAAAFGDVGLSELAINLYKLVALPE